MATNFIPRLIKRRLKQILDGAGYEIFNKRNGYAQDGLLTLHSDHFRNDPQFRAAYKRGIKASAGVDPHFEWRVHVALWGCAYRGESPRGFRRMRSECRFHQLSDHAETELERDGQAVLFDRYV